MVLQIKENFPDKTVLYVSGEQFYHQFVDAVKNNSTNDFVHFYQLIDVLIIDDIQFFSGKEKTQDVFFHLFNNLHQKGKQIIITSDKAPIEMKNIEPRLIVKVQMGFGC